MIISISFDDDIVHECLTFFWNMSIQNMIAIWINCLTKLIVFWKRIIMRNNSKKIMNAIKFRFRLSKNNWSYFEKKSIEKIIYMSANSSTNAFIWKNKLIFEIVTRLIFIAALIIRYLLIFFLIKNQKLRYKSWHFSKSSTFIFSRSIFMTVFWKILKIRKSAVYQISWKTVRIFMNEIISNFI